MLLEKISPLKHFIISKYNFMSVQNQPSESLRPASTEPNKSAAPDKNPVRRRRRQGSALIATAQYSSRGGAAGAHAYFDTGIESTGVNIKFRKQGGID